MLDTYYDIHFTHNYGYSPVYELNYNASHYTYDTYNYIMGQNQIDFKLDNFSVPNFAENHFSDFQMQPMFSVTHDNGFQLSPMLDSLKQYVQDFYIPMNGFYQPEFGFGQDINAIAHFNFNLPF